MFSQDALVSIRDVVQWNPTATEVSGRDGEQTFHLSRNEAEHLLVTWYNEHGWSVQSAAKLYLERGYDYTYFSQMYKCLYILRRNEFKWEALDEAAFVFQTPA